jgi:hypothetical protein
MTVGIGKLWLDIWVMIFHLQGTVKPKLYIKFLKI